MEQRYQAKKEQKLKQIYFVIVEILTEWETKTVMKRIPIGGRK